MSVSNCMNVIVLDGNENQAVAAVRSLARAGHRVVLGSDTSWSKAGWSRGAGHTFQYPSPQMAMDQFIERLIIEVRRHAPALVLPMTERTTLPISSRREEIIRAGGLLVLPPHETVLMAFDKQATTALAQRLGIVVPETVLISNRSEAEAFAERNSFPIVLKPRSSEEISSNGRVLATGAPTYAKSADEFLSAFNGMMHRCSSVLAQEFVAGSGAGYFALMKDGELRAEFAHRRLRDVRPTGSGSAVRESVLPDPQLRDAALSILTALRWHGVAMVEFRQRADGTPVFLEVNGRFWNSLPLSVYAGVDFPLLMAKIAETGDVFFSGGYKVGIRCRWLLGDFRHLIEVWRGAPEGYPGKFPPRLRTLSSFLMPVRGTFHDNFIWNDPLPEIGDWMDFFLRKLPSRLRNRSTDPEFIDAQGRYSLS